MNQDFTYCLGKNCTIKEYCVRYKEGKRLPDGNWWWMEQCDEETRDGYINTKDNEQAK